MWRGNSLYLAVALAVILCAGCGTTHYMLPGRPLERKEWQVSVVWHYEFNRLTKPRAAFFPDINAYVGAGKDYNFGFGAHTLGWPSHLSVAKYWQKSDDRYWAAYSHLSAGLGNNPPIEAGALYSNDNGDLGHTFSLGFGVGQLRAPDLSSARIKHASTLAGINPVIKYVMEGTDVSLTYTHYLWQSWRAMRSLWEEVRNHNDTVLSYAKGELTAIVPLGRVKGQGIGPASGWGLIDSKGDTAVLVREYPCPDCFYERWTELEYWLGDSLRVYRYDTAMMIVSVPDLLRNWRYAYRRTGKLNVTRFSPALNERINSTRNLLRDASLGIAVNMNSKPGD